MGNEQQKTEETGVVPLHLNHLKFQNAKIITEHNQKLIQTTLGVDEE